MKTILQIALVLSLIITGCGTSLDRAATQAAEDRALSRMALASTGEEGGYIPPPSGGGGSGQSDSGVIPPSSCNGIVMTATLSKLMYSYDQVNNPKEPDGVYRGLALTGVVQKSTPGKTFPMGVASLAQCGDGLLCGNTRVFVSTQIRNVLQSAMEVQKTTGKHVLVGPLNVEFCAGYTQELPANTVLWSLDVRWMVLK